MSKSSIFKRQNGYYYYRRQVNGKYIRPSLNTKNKEEAKRLQKIKDQEFDTLEFKGILHQYISKVPKLQDAIDKYLIHKKINFRFATYNNDRKRLKLVLEFIGNIPLNKIDENLINEFIDYRSDLACYTTYRGDLVCLKAMLNYYYKRDILNSNPFRHIPIKQIPTNPVYLNEDEVEQLINLDYPKRPWMTNFFRVALLTGFRRGELVGLKWSDIDYQKNEITVIGKTGLRTFPINGYEILINTLEEIPKKSEYVFHETKYESKPIINDKLSNYVREVFNHLEFSRRYTLHSLRHTFGAHQYRGGTPLEKIQLMMGHSTIAVTQMYAHIGITGSDVSNGLQYASLISTPFSEAS